MMKVCRGSAKAGAAVSVALCALLSQGSLPKAAEVANVAVKAAAQQWRLS